MSTAKPFHGYDSASYRIVVQGVLDPCWSDWLEGMQIGGTVTPEGIAISVLEGNLADQSALVGVINTLHTLNLPLLAVERLD